MKTQITLQMQKVQKLVIKILLLAIACQISNSYAQKKGDIYSFAEQIIQLTLARNDSAYILNENIIVKKYFLKNYYEFRTNGRPFYNFFVVDSITDEIGTDSIQLKKDMIRWNEKYKYLDSLFSDNDIKVALNNSETEEKWDTYHRVFNKDNYVIHWCFDYYCENSISKAYYNHSKTHAFVWSSHSNNNRRYIDLYIFKKKEDDWHILEKIENIGW